MVFRIKITFPEDVMQENRLRMEARNNFEIYDRVPAVAWIDARYPLHARGFTFEDYFKSPKAHIYHQLHNAKWVIDNVRDDHVTEPCPLSVRVHWGTLTAGGFGAPIGWSKNNPPHPRPLINNVEEIDKLEVPDVSDNLFGKTLQWYHEMCKLTKSDFEVVFNGKKLDVKVYLPRPQQFTAAVDLAGHKLYAWLYRYPDACHKLLKKITEACIRWGKCAQDLTGEPMNMGGDGDAAGFLSVDLFRKFVMPYMEQLYALTPSERPFHSDGNVTHLLDCFFTELKITHFNCWGWQVDPKVTCEKILRSGRRIYLIGNVSPLLVYTGPVSEIVKASFDCLQAVAPCGGHVLSDGCNIPPGTPLEHIEAMRKASEIYGSGRCGNCGS